MQPFPTGKYGAILCDPPWPYSTYSPKGKGRSSEAYYDALSIDDIKAFAVGERWALPDCAMFLWVTKPILPRAFEIIEGWGFTYKSNAFVWVKTYPETGDALFELQHRYFFGLGRWTRSNPEQCLLATRGKPRRINADVPELIVSAIREHCRKPDEVYARIERLVSGPYLELFASSTAIHRPGWTRIVGKDQALARRWPSDSFPGAENAPAP